MMVVRRFFENFRRRKQELKNRKIMYLYHQTYNYYLNQYLLKAVNDIDFPAFMYETGLIICKTAREKALKDIELVIKEDRVNECVKKFQTGIKKI